MGESAVLDGRNCKGLTNSFKFGLGPCIICIDFEKMVDVVKKIIVFISHKTF